MQIVRQSSFTSNPWKNGGGVTFEALRVPPEGPFRWRVSIAQIDSSGPFSYFAGYARKMVLLRGAGMRLTFGDDRQTVLRQPGDLVEFDGATATQCDLLDGPCTDLNLMVANSITGASARVDRLDTPRQLGASNPETVLVVPICGRLSIGPGQSGPEKLGDAELHAWDLAVVPPGTECTITPILAGIGDAPLVFFAALDDTIR